MAEDKDEEAPAKDEAAELGDSAATKNAGNEDTTTKGNKETETNNNNRQRRGSPVKHPTNHKFQFDVLATEESGGDHAGEVGLPSVLDDGGGGASDDKLGASTGTFKSTIRQAQQRRTFWHRMVEAEKQSVEKVSQALTAADRHDFKRKKHDPYFDYAEKSHRPTGLSEAAVETLDGEELNDSDTVSSFLIPTLKECKSNFLHNAEAERHEKHSNLHHVINVILNYFAAIYIYLANTLKLESVVVVANAAGATAYYTVNSDDYAVKLDFSFLAFAVVFPLTFLLQSTFTRRDAALTRLADFKGSVVATVLFTLTVDWPSSASGSAIGGRSELPEAFDANVLDDFRELIVLVYQFLSMPNVQHARHVVFWSKQRSAKRVHALQNQIVRQLHNVFFDMSMHTEEMRVYGFPSGEASRLHQYHQYLQQRFEQLRVIKYYRTPQASRSFGRAYLIILPWLCGPYFAWVKESTSQAFAITLASFTFLIILGLLSAVTGMEDPFLQQDITSWTPGIDSVKLDFEMAQLLQAIEQYYGNAESKKKWAKKQMRKKEAE